MRVRALRDNVIVDLIDEPPTLQTPSGLILAPKKHGKGVWRAIVLTTGPGLDDGVHRTPSPVGEGAVILIEPGTSYEVVLDLEGDGKAKVYRMLKHHEILGVDGDAFPGAEKPAVSTVVSGAIGGSYALGAGFGG